MRAHDRADGPERRDRSLLRLVLGHPGREPAGSGIAQVILGLGHDEPGLRRRELQACPQLAEVFLDQVARVAHAGNPTTACTPTANLRHSVCSAASAAAPWSVSP